MKPSVSPAPTVNTGTGNAGPDAQVSGRDVVQVRANLYAGSEVSGAFDFNRDGVVNFADVAIQRAAFSRALRLITPGGGDGLW